ncbi:FtsK/SpoIIIE domain-containing protein [Furfurilactobacillus milii]|uniref:DUF87 domain-containing protein n=1 Tax=Furfurilactobacillus milii TaxID=2888272 RepID=A0A6N9I001_9LACO|nr:FtsK/SpoIIIE domain-containing protein [Furfurilactobacillus milii]MYV16067.1 DUF87 domain-containing protein [Furfurilactobacillus milii]
MRSLFIYRGRRIRLNDRYIIFRTMTAIALILFLTMLVIGYWPNLSRINYQTASWPFIQSLPWTLTPIIVSIITTIIVMTAGFVAWTYWFADSYKQLQHIQKIARMFFDNNWYETQKVESGGFFKDLSKGKTKEKVRYFPRVYYRRSHGLIHINVEVVMSSYQDQLLTLESKLESGLYCELVDKMLHDSFVEYVLLYDTLANRITIDQVTCENGAMRLMDDVYWKYDSLPHMLIAGGTGGGKTYFILTLINALVKTNAKLTILDPKNADLADLATVLPDVHSKKEDMLAALDAFYAEMMARNDQMKQMDGYKTGENYAYLGLPAHFLIFDEYVAFMDMLGRDAIQVMNKLKQIVMLGRQSGFFLILACQRPDAKYLGDGIRDQFMFRVALGRMSEMGYAMMFGEQNKDYFNKPIKGRGYVDTGGSVISEFYTPLVPKSFDFLSEINGEDNLE